MLSFYNYDIKKIGWKYVNFTGGQIIKNNEENLWNPMSKIDFFFISPKEITSTKV